MLAGLLDMDAAARPPGSFDPFFSSVKLLMGFEGADGSTGAPGMTDESPAAHGNAIVQAGASISTAQFKFGTSSLVIDGNSDIAFAPSSDWTFGAGLFTIEMVIRPHTLPAFNQFLSGQWSFIDGNNAWVFYIATNKLAWGMTASGSGAGLVGMIGTTTLVVDSAQYSVAVDYDGSKYRLYLNGVMEGSYSTPTTIHDTGGGINLQMGSAFPAGSGSGNYNGYQDELRITKGVARYASDAGYTPATARFPRS